MWYPPLRAARVLCGFPEGIGASDPESNRIRPACVPCGEPAVSTKPVGWPVCRRWGGAAKCLRLLHRASSAALHGLCAGAVHRRSGRFSTSAQASPGWKAGVGNAVGRVPGCDAGHRTRRCPTKHCALLASRPPSKRLPHGNRGSLRPVAARQLANPSANRVRLLRQVARPNRTCKQKVAAPPNSASSPQSWVGD